VGLGVVLALALLLALALGLQGCGDPRSAHTGDAKPTFGRTRPVDPRVFRFANGAEPEVLDPALMSGQPDGRIARALFEGLASQHPRTLDPVPGVAHRWDVSADGRTYTFHLRPDARWTNGDAVTARDFEWSWLRVLHPETPSRYADLFYLIRNGRAYKTKAISDAAQVGIRAVDDSTFQVELESPTPYFPQLAAYYPFMPVHRATFERCGDRWTRPEHIVGNGAFRLALHRPNDRIELVRNDTYWDVRNVRLERIVIYASDDLATMLNMYRAGMTDWNPSGYLPAQYIPYVRDYADYRAGPYLGTYFYSFNTTQPPFDDRRVRRALGLAVDRERITRYLLHESKKAWGGIVPPGFESYPYPQGVAFDPDRARALLAEAGYPGGRGFPKAEILFNTSQDHRKIAEAIQEMWKRELGIDVSLTNQEFASYLKATTSLQYQVARRAWIGDYKDPNTFLYCLRSGDGNNRSGWSHAGYDSLIARAGRTLDPQDRMRILAEAEAVALEEMPFMPIYGYLTVEMVAPYVRGWYPTALDMHPLKDIWLDDTGEASTAATTGAQPSRGGDTP
jgi:oligopeptide transport system substrate-binding protein